MAPFQRTFAALGLLVTLASGTTFADTYRHIDDLAKDIERKSREIEREVRHYRHTPEYRHLVSDAREMRKLADHLHDVAHDHGSISHMACDLRELDARFHHLESVFQRVERGAAFGHGHIHGETTRVAVLLHSIEDSIHHLQSDLHALQAPTLHRRPVVISRPPIVVAPQLNRWGNQGAYRDSYNHGSHGCGSPSRGGYSGGSRGGITIGGGSSRFTIRW